MFDQVGTAHVKTLLASQLAPQWAGVIDCGPRPAVGLLFSSVELMANPQPNKFTKISNELLEQLCGLSLSRYEWSTLLMVLRLSYGFHLKQVEISVKSLSDALQISSPHMFRTLRSLATLKIMRLELLEGIALCRLNKDYDQWVRQKRPKSSGRRCTISFNGAPIFKQAKEGL